MGAIPSFIIAAAPHRLLFFVGASNVLLAMAWWTLWLLQSRWPLLELAQPPIPAGWLHAFLMQYQVLPAFIFGFLLTVFPRWTDQQALSRRHYVPVGLGLLGGQLATLLGAFGSLALLQAGTLLALVGWSYGAVQLWRIVWRDAAKTAHAVSCLAAVLFGLAGLLLHAAFLYSGDAWMTFGSLKLGTFALLLPIFFTVCHRMVPCRWHAYQL